MRKLVLTAGAVALVLGMHAHSHAADQNADHIYKGRTIVTASDLQPDAEAVAVRGGHVVAVAYRDEVTKLKLPNTKVIDLAGRTMVPGLIDARGHVFAAGIQALSANLLPPPDGEGIDITSLHRLLKDWVAKNRAATDRVGWIIGFGYNDSQLNMASGPIGQRRFAQEKKPGT